MPQHFLTNADNRVMVAAMTLMPAMPVSPRLHSGQMGPRVEGLPPAATGAIAAWAVCAGQRVGKDKFLPHPPMNMGAFVGGRWTSSPAEIKYFRPADHERYRLRGLDPAQHQLHSNWLDHIDPDRDYIDQLAQKKVPNFLSHPLQREAIVRDLITVAGKYGQQEKLFDWCIELLTYKFDLINSDRKLKNPRTDNRYIYLYTQLEFILLTRKYASEKDIQQYYQFASYSESTIADAFRLLQTHVKPNDPRALLRYPGSRLLRRIPEYRNLLSDAEAKSYEVLRSAIG